ncbi:hypothetical protein ACF059_18040 [Streptomyces sp. NPDC016562]|uniref:hypothetical protein n=1 Tax=Streptomyces sp. NPDC016562 TaxID=3364966 RepID=UPI0036F53B7F
MDEKGSSYGGKMGVFFSDHFGVTRGRIEEYGALDICLISDLPLFIDPFLLFHSEKEEYRTLHEGILNYMAFLRDKSTEGKLAPGLLESWFYFKEVKQNWLGFTVLGNGGRALGASFARSLNQGLAEVFQNFGHETVTEGSHPEKICLITGGVGRDSISDFTTNLIKGYLLDYTQRFTLDNVEPELRKPFRVRRVRFNYETETWEDGEYVLPRLRDDFILLTPKDILTRDDTWINRRDLVKDFHELPLAVSNIQLREQVSNYFYRHLSKKPKRKEIDEAAIATIRQFPELVDYYIKLKEDSGDIAVNSSALKVEDLVSTFIEGLDDVISDLQSKIRFYEKLPDSRAECLARVNAFKRYVEHQDGYRLINRRGRGFSQESEIQLFFGLIWYGTAFDVNREVNNGRGPVDYKISSGSTDKTLIEFKLASNSHLKRNLEHQVAIYEQANDAANSIKVIISYTEAHEMKARRILSDLGLSDRDDVILIDARSDNKPSASTA